jgi:hypothetical protein
MVPRVFPRVRRLAGAGEVVTVYEVTADGRVLMDVTSSPPGFERMRAVLAAYRAMVLQFAPIAGVA